MSGGHGHAPEGANKYVALMIAVLALCLAFSEMLGKHAEKASLQANIEANNLWSFFQAKTIRRSVAQNLVELVEIDSGTAVDEARKAAITKQVASWKSLANRLESEPETREGRKELMARAIEAQKIRDKYNVKHEGFEIASAIFQVAIVVASAMIITGIGWLIWLAAGLGVAAAMLMGVSQFASHILPFAH